MKLSARKRAPVPIVFLAFAGVCSLALGKQPTLVLPAKDVPLFVSVDLPPSVDVAKSSSWTLGEADSPQTVLPAQLAPAVGPDGTVARPRGRLLAIVPPREGLAKQRSFRLLPADDEECKAAAFSFEEISKETVKLSENGSPVFAYNHGIITDDSVPENDPRRSCGSYIHPAWGLSGEVLTDAFPPDHYHHQGIFWRWKDIEVEGKHYHHWENKNIHTKFVRWLHRSAGPVAAVLGVENGWFADVGNGQEEKVMIERVWLTAYRAGENSRSLDIELTIIPVDKPATLTGADGKSYGGLTMRFDAWPRTDAVVRAPDQTVSDEGRQGLTAKGDLANTPLLWADFSAKFPGADQRSGAAVFIHPNHPDYPPSWLTRCYGPLCVGWPGVESKTLPPDDPVRLPYRIWIHKTEVDHDRLGQEYESYTATAEAGWRG